MKAPDEEYKAAAIRASRALSKATSWFKSQGYVVRADYWWPQDAPRWGLRWDPHEGHFMFARAVEAPVDAGERPRWVHVLGGLAAPGDPRIEDPEPLFATLTFVPELAYLARLAKEHAIIQLNQGSDVVDAWLSEVAPPVKT